MLTSLLDLQRRVMEKKTQPQGTEKQPSRSIKIQKMKEKKIQNSEEKNSLDLCSGTSGTQRSKRRKDPPRLHSFLAETTKRGLPSSSYGHRRLQRGIQRERERREEEIRKQTLLLLLLLLRTGISQSDRKVEGKGRKSTVVNSYRSSLFGDK